MARQSTVPDNRRPAISPRAFRAAIELGVDWAKLAGSGRTGRIRECDVSPPPKQRPTDTQAEDAFLAHRQSDHRHRRRSGIGAAIAEAFAEAGAIVYRRRCE